MKRLKFTENQIQPILDRKIFRTWRLEDDKDLSLGDRIELVNTKNGSTFAWADVEEITPKYIKDLDNSDKEGHQKFQSDEEMYHLFETFYGHRIGPQTPVKVIKFSLIDKQLSVNGVTNTTKYKDIKLFSDGGSRGNPGPSAGGYIIYDKDDNILYSGGEYLGITTNNQAEYHAVKMGLKKCLEYQPSVVKVYMDSLLVVNQLNTIYKITNRDLWPIHTEIRKICQSISKVSFIHIPREMNKLADAEVNRILDLNK